MELNEQNMLAGEGWFSKLFGGGGGSSTPPPAPRPAHEDPNTLSSKAVIRVQEVISEGEIKGLVNGAKSIYFDNTQYQNNDNTYNFGNYKWDFRVGTPDQTYMPQFEGIETIGSVNLELDPNNPPAPKTINDLVITSAKVGVLVQALYSTDKTTGDIHGSSVNISIQTNTDGIGWVTVATDTISGKTTSPYERTYKIAKPAGVVSQWQIRVIRTSALAQDSSIQNTIYWNVYSTLIEKKFIYPDTAYIGLEISSQEVGSNIPRRSYLVDGIKIQIPDNYTPLAYNIDGTILTTPSYTGIWGGTFTTAWCNNPAWVLYDLITNNRYGIGEFLDASQVDKYAFYTIAQYCDQLVDDGNGGTEPRYVFNGVINTREDAYKVLQAVASTFRGMLFWGSGAITAIQDAPKDPVKLVNPENVIAGSFTYSSTALKARHTTCHVTWNNPADGYKADVEVIEDSNLIRRYGTRNTELYAVGTTSRAQAHRLGKWLLYSEHNETETVAYRASFDHADVAPGDIIRIADPVYAGVESGGRIVDSTINTITLEQSFNFNAASGYKIHWIRDKNETSTVTNTPGNYTVITVSPAFSEVPATYSDYALYGDNGSIVKGKVISATTSSITLDRTVNLQAAVVYKLTIEKIEVETRDITNSVGVASVVTVSSNFTSIPNKQYVYVISHVDSGTRLFKVVNVKEIEAGIFEIGALLHNENKYNEIEAGIYLPPSDKSRYQLDKIAAPTNVTAIAEPKLNATGDIIYDIKITWDRVKDAALAAYKVVYKFEKQNPQLASRTENTTGYINNATEGNYVIYVSAINHFGFESLPTVIDFVAKGSIPLTPTGFEIVNQGNDNSYGGKDINLQWRRTSYTAKNSLDRYNAATTLLNPFFSHWKLGIYRTNGTLIQEEKLTNNFYTFSYDKNTYRDLVFKLWTVDKVGRQSLVPAKLTVSNPLPVIPIIEYTGLERAVEIKFDKPTDSDYIGCRVYRSITSSDLTGTPTSSFLIYEGTNSRINDINLLDDYRYYYKIEFLDAFSTTGVFSAVSEVWTKTLTLTGTGISSIISSIDTTPKVDYERYELYYNSTPFTVGALIPVAGVCIRARVVVTTAWNTAETFSIQKNDTTVLIDSTDVDLTTVGIYEKNIWVVNAADDTIELAELTTTGGPTQGRATVLIEIIND